MLAFKELIANKERFSFFSSEPLVEAALQSEDPRLHIGANGDRQLFPENRPTGRFSVLESLQVYPDGALLRRIRPVVTMRTPFVMAESTEKNIPDSVYRIRKQN